MRLLSEGLLGEFDGSDPHKPIYLAVRFCVCVLGLIVVFVPVPSARVAGWLASCLPFCCPVA